MDNFLKKILFVNQEKQALSDQQVNRSQSEAGDSAFGYLNPVDPGIASAGQSAMMCNK